MKPLYRIFFVLTACCLLCQGSYMILNEGLLKYNVHKTDRLNELLLGQTKHDILFIGSSRVHTGINPRIVDSITGMESYNAGVEGGRINEFKMTLDAYLETHEPPKVLVLSADLFGFDLRRPFFNHTQYFSYLSNPVVRDNLDKFGHNTFLIRYIPFIRLTDYDDYTRSNALKGLAGKTEIADGEFQYKGYMSNTMNVIDTGSLRLPDKINAIISEGSLDYLKAIVDTCSKRSIKLVWIYTPEYKHLIQQQTPNAGKVLSLIEGKSKEYGIPFLRHDYLALCNNSNLFANPGHLNTLGATLYSSILAQELKTNTLK